MLADSCDWLDGKQHELRQAGWTEATWKAFWTEGKPCFHTQESLTAWPLTLGVCWFIICLGQEAAEGEGLWMTTMTLIAAVAPAPASAPDKVDS